MAEQSVFDRLVGTLSTSERIELLEKVQRNLAHSGEPLLAEAEDAPEVDVDEELRRLSPLRLLWMFLKSVITGKERRALMAEELRRRLEISIERQYRGLADFRAGLLLERMYEELAALGECASLFREPLHQALGSRRQDFFAFLVRDELPELQERIVLETDPTALRGDLLLSDESAVRQEMLRRFGQILESIPEEDRARLHLETRALHSFHVLSSQPFDSMLACFSPLHGAPGRAGEFYRLKRHLSSLADALLAVRFPPAQDTLKALFLFFERDRLARADFDLEERLVRYFSRTEEALAGIRAFNARVPLCGLIRAASGDLNYRPREAGGGEDWLALFREFWRRRLEDRWQTWRRQLQRERLTSELLRLTGLSRLPDPAPRPPDGRQALSLSALRGFRQGVLPRISRPLRLILLQGEFYKPDNRREFAEALERLERIGAAAPAAETERAPVVDPREAEACLGSMIRLLGGILTGKPGAPYDTLINFSTLGGTENRKLAAAWQETLDLISRQADLLREIRDLERADGPQSG